MFRINLDEINHLIRVLVNTIVRESPRIGELGVCSSHSKFGYVMNKVFQDALKKSFDLSIGLTEKDIFEIYQKLYLACADLKSFMGSDENDFIISSKCAYIEEYTNRLYSNITHPTPLERRRHLEICISQFC